MRLAKFYVFFIVIILVGCINTGNEKELRVNIQNKDMHKDENIFIKETDEQEMGFKPEYKVQISLEDDYSSNIQLFGEPLEYLKINNNEAKFDITFDVDSSREKNFRVMIWDGEKFISIVDDTEERTEKYIDIYMPKGKNHLVLNNELDLFNNFQMSELAFIIHDSDIPADIDINVFPIRMYITEKDRIVNAPINNDDLYQEEKSFLRDKTDPNDSGSPHFTILDKDKNVLKDDDENPIKQLTKETSYLSINQADYDVKESIIFYDIDGNIYESYFIEHPSDKDVIVPIPDEIKSNIGKTDYYVLLNTNFGDAGIQEIKKIVNDENIPYLNHSFLIKLGEKQ